LLAGTAAGGGGGAGDPKIPPNGSSLAGGAIELFLEGGADVGGGGPELGGRVCPHGSAVVGAGAGGAGVMGSKRPPKLSFCGGCVGCWGGIGFGARCCIGGAGGAPPPPNILKLGTGG